MFVADGEVAASSLPNKPCVHCPVTMADTSQLAAKAAELLPNKSATIICFFVVGGRVMGAKKALEEAGCASRASRAPTLMDAALDVAQK